MRRKKFMMTSSSLKKTLDIAQELEEIRALIDELKARMITVVQPFLRDIGPIVQEMNDLNLCFDEIKKGVDEIKHF